MRKRAQGEGKGVAVLLLLLALFVVLYLLLLPPEERENILNQTYGEESGTFSPKLLLSEVPGEVYSTESKSTIHEFSPISLFIRTEPKTDRLANSLEVSRSLFSSKPQELSFYTEDLANIENAYLFFSVLNSKGNLEIWINNHIIIDQAVSGTQSIELPPGYLNKQNIITIKASSPGLAFFLKNSYSLSDVIIKTSYKRLNPEESRAFTIPKEEKDNLQKAELSFSIYCNDLNKDTSALNIYVNERSILQKQVSCSGNDETIEIDSSYLSEGSNKFTFSISDGDFQFSKIKLKTNLKESAYPQYHFDVKDEDWDYLKDGTAKAKLNLKLFSGSKQASFIINGHQLTMSTSELTFTKDVTDFIETGDNYIKIVPQNKFIIDNLEIKLESA